MRPVAGAAAPQREERKIADHPRVLALESEQEREAVCSLAKARESAKNPPPPQKKKQRDKSSLLEHLPKLFMQMVFFLLK